MEILTIFTGSGKEPEKQITALLLTKNGAMRECISALLRAYLRPESEKSLPQTFKIEYTCTQK